MMDEKQYPSSSSLIETGLAREGTEDIIHIARPPAVRSLDSSVTSITPSACENAKTATGNRDDERSLLVSWDSPDDPQNPLNWPPWKKRANIGLVSMLTLTTPLASFMFAPGVPEVMKEFHSSDNLLAGLLVSIPILGVAVGPLFLAPMSELYGRLWIYHISNLGFVTSTILCASSSSLGMLTTCRYFQGVFGAAPLTNGGGTIVDTIVQERRGTVLAAYTVASMVALVVGPTIGGFIVASQGWRWAFWDLAIVSGLLALLSLALLRETCAAVILGRKAARLRMKTGDSTIQSDLAKNLDSTAQQLFWRAITRPQKILLFSPIALVLSIYTGVVCGYQFLMLSTFTFVFEAQYGFPTSVIGLAFLGLGIGALVGLLVLGRISDRILEVKSRPSAANPSGIKKAEYRLIPLEWGSMFLPAGLFLYGWSAEYKVHWIVPLLGTAVISFGQMVIFNGITSYLVDAFQIYAASALAANTLVRSVLGAFLPLAGQSMYDALGYGWGNSLLGFVALALTPLPFVLTRYGEAMRKRFDASRL